jgi:VPDSG-CTERM motif
MKVNISSTKKLAILTLAIAGLATHADAIPITYSYVGANFTFGTGQPGFSTSDNITASFTVSNPLAPSMTFNLANIGATMRTISNGVFTFSLTGGNVTTDTSGNIVGWSLFEEELQPDFSIVDLESFWDGAIGGDDAHQFLADQTSFDAGNTVPGIWSLGPASVPDGGATLALVGLALAGVAVLRRKLPPS